MKKKEYYNSRRLKSRNGVMNIVVGKRSKGKTYAFVRDAIQDYLNGKGEFMFCRRYKKEVNKNKQKLVFKIMRNEFPDFTFRVKGTMLQLGKMKDNPKDITYFTVGYFVALTEEEDLKSTPLDDITSIIFDEFIIKKKSHKRYIYDEVFTLMSLYDTVDREMNKTKLYLLGNSLNFSNPYFLEYGIKVEDFKNNEFIKKRDGYVIVQMIPEDYNNAVEENNTWSSKIAPKRYNEMSLGNKFQEDNNDFIFKYNKNELLFLYNIHNGRDIFSVYDVLSGRERVIFITETKKYDKNNSFSINKNSFVVDFPYNTRVHTFILNKLYANKIQYNNINTREKIINNIKR